jgi:uncharacterized membrane protein YgcG
MQISSYKQSGVAFGIALAVCLWLAIFQAPSAQAEVIRKFDVDLKLNADSTLDVLETIRMDFENSQRHGIYRRLPVKYRRYNGDYTLGFDLLSVTDDQNRPLHYSQTSTGSEVNIRIGDADILLSGQHTYRIHYLVRRAVNFFDNEPEVYWNATGDAWPYGIEATEVRFFAPQGVSLDKIRTITYVGIKDSKQNGESRLSLSDPRCIIFSAPYLADGEEFTIVARLPVGSVTRPSAWQEFVSYLLDWWGLAFFPGLTCLFLLPRLQKSNQDPAGHRAIAVEWNPPKDLSPAEVGTLIDESCDMPDIVSTLVDLAARGYLKIKQLQTNQFLFLSTKDYEFERTSSQNGKDRLLPHESLFLAALFAHSASSVTLSSLRDKFYTYLPGIRDDVYKSLTDKGLFVENPQSVRLNYTWIGIVIIVAGLVLGGQIGLFVRGCLAGGLVVSGGIVMALSNFMPARTRKGWEEKAEILAFQKFVRLAEKDRIAVLAKEDPTIFGRLLPYAMVLGAADQWALAFRDLLTEPPNWYVPYNYGNSDYNFSSNSFVNDLGHGMTTMGQTFSSSPSSSAGSGGSGFSGGGSGGGFGGGGGGSW